MIAVRQIFYIEDVGPRLVARFGTGRIEEFLKGYTVNSDNNIAEFRL